MLLLYILICRLHSLDGWLSYASMKEKVLAHLYTNSAFMLGANNSYRSLFWRLIESLELLSVLTQCHQHRNPLSRGNSVVKTSQQNDNWGLASRLPTDSRIPKSSSIPSRLESENVGKLNKKIKTHSILQKDIQNQGRFFLEVGYEKEQFSYVSQKAKIDSNLVFCPKGKNIIFCEQIENLFKKEKNKSLFSLIELGFFS